jgi:uncharacterized protein (TIGR00297 family)
MAMPRSPEARRQVLHMLVGAFALLLRVLTWWQAALLAAVAVLFNVFVLPRLARDVFRPADLDSPVRSGIVIYPLSVLGLILCFPHRLDIAAAAWGILAAGDGMATLVGAHVRTRPLPWNPAKSLGGLLAFLAAGSLAGVGLAVWTAGGMSEVPRWWMVAAPSAAAVAAGFVETVPIRLNDNISVPLVAALVLWTLGLTDAGAFHAAAGLVAGRLGPALALNAAAALAGWRARTVTVAGALTGAVIGVAVYLGAGWPGWVVLFASFLAAAAATRAGFRRKALVGIAETRGGARGPGNALANTGVGAWAALVSLGLTQPGTAHLAMVAGLVTASADTVASEIGKAWGGTPWLVTGWQRVPPGTPGAVSLEGTAAGLAASALLAGLAVWLDLLPPGAIAVVVVAAAVASLAESALGARFEGPGILDNDALNFINSLLGAGLAVAVWSLR